MITGVVLNKENNSPIQFANVALLNNGVPTGHGVATGAAGNFSIENNGTGANQVQVSFIGFKPQTFAIGAMSPMIFLEPASVAIGTAEIVGTRNPFLEKERQAWLYVLGFILVIIAASIIVSRNGQAS
ncbi:MAG: carboxypeptidase-like regulatory domain-containing protein [Verrucomicrobiales bacterium]|nr:carboxypeptidase-like regulatory domain-containing protein [Verrucomicrobiales bacterium]